VARSGAAAFALPMTATGSPAPAGKEQQRVIGPRAEHEHHEDPAALPVDGQVRMLRQQVDDRLCRDERDAGGQDRQQPQDRAPVSQQEQRDDHRQGREQQRGIDALEDLQLVRRAGGRSGDVDRYPWIACGRGCLQAVDEFLDVGGVAEVRADNGLDRPVVGRRDRACHPAGDNGDGRELACVGGGLVQVGAGDPGLPLVDQHGRVEVLRGKPGLQVQFLGRVGTGRKVGRGVVLFRALQLARQRSGEGYARSRKRRRGIWCACRKAALRSGGPCSRSR
jgi:hypothetical protein